MKRKIIGIPALIVCVLLLISALCVMFLQKNSKQAHRVHIYRADTLLKTLPLSEDTIYKIDDIGMVIEVSNGRAFIKQSRCRCKTCQSFGKLSKAGQSALCLPDRILIKLDGQSSVDAEL